MHLSKRDRSGGGFALSVITVISLAASLFTNTVYANLTSNSLLDKQRVIYQRLSDQLEKGQLVQVRQNLDALKNYPLKPYLEAQIISRQLDTLSPEQINRFISENKNIPAVEDLQQKWLNTLASRNDWGAYRSAYKAFRPRGNHYKCLMLKAEMEQGDLATQLDRVAVLWQQGVSQPKSCDSVFAYWQRRGGLTQKIAETRFWNAVQSRNLTLARYVDKKITDQNAKADTQLFWQVRDNPSRWLQESHFSVSNDHHRLIVDYAIRRFARQDLKAAAQRWIKLRSAYDFSLKEQARINNFLGVRLALRFDDDAPELLALLDPQYRHPDITEWRIRLAMSHQDWPQVRTLISHLPVTDKSSSRWRYWLAVAEQNISGQLPDKLFAEISRERSYYGFLASEQLGKPFSLNYEPANFAASVQQKLMVLPAVRRMYELVQIEDFSFARQEWNQVFPVLNKEQKHALSHLAASWQWYSQGIVGAAQIKKWNDLQLRFPMEYPELYRKHAEQQNIPMNWALSITRRESAFNPSARSSVGAMGLMQLMPKTAREVAKKSLHPLGKIKDLYKPKTNIALGTAYLAQMLNRYNGSRIYATAAYNAGPSRVDRWLKERGHLPLDIWIEIIPFEETRHYVQRVLEYGVVYDLMANRPTHLLNDNERQLLALNLLEGEDESGLD